MTTETTRDWRNPPPDRQPAESTMPFYHHVQAEQRDRERILSRPAVRWVKVAWLGGLMRSQVREMRDAAKAALECVDAEDARGLVVALRTIEAAAVSSQVKDLACGAADAVERAIREGER